MPTQPQTRVLRIDITGHDHPGVTHSLTTILAKSGAPILDIGQAVIHDSLALGLLVELTDELKSSSLLTELLLKAAPARRADPVHRDLRRGVRQLGARAGKGRYLVSVLGPTLRPRTWPR